MTGDKALRSDVHSKGLWHLSVHVWVINDKGELLLQKRSPNKENYPNLWDIPSAGHVTAGDSSLETAVRETSEELSIKLPKEDFVLVASIKESAVSNGGLYINNEFNDIYLVKSNIELEDIKIQAEEVSEIKFISQEELKRMVGDNHSNLVAHPEEYRILFKYLEDK